MSDTDAADRRELELVIAALMVGKHHTEKPEERDYLARILPTLQRCLERMQAHNALVAKLAGAMEELAMERSSRRRLQKIINEGAVLLPGCADNYPAEIRPFVQAIHKEADNA